MDIVSLGVLLLMVLLGGLTAFLADLLAWRIGKRRLSMMNMRPKHFARLVVTVAGVLIPLFTILAIASASSDVRTWIARGRTAAIQLPEVTRERDARAAEVAALEAQRQRLQGENERVGGEVKTQKETLRNQGDLVKKQAGDIKDQAGKIQAQSDRIALLTPRLERLVREAALSAKETALLKKQTAAAKIALASAKVSLATALAEQTALQGETKIIKRESAIIQRESARIKSENELAYKDYTATNERNRDLEAKRAELQARTDDLATEIKKLEGERTTAEQNARVARSELAELEGQIADLQTSQSALRLILRQTNALARTAPLAFRRGDELGRLVVPAGSSVAAARGIVRNLIAATADDAVRRGAQAGGGLPITYLGEAEPKTKGLSPDAKIEYWGGQLAGRNGDTVLVAASEYNFFAGEAVALSLAPFDDPVVFAPGALIAEARVDGRRSDATVYAQIAEFLGTRVQERARKEGLIPQRSGGEASFGEVTTAQILDATREIREANRPVRLQALADGEVRAGDRLKLTLRIR